MSRESCRDSDGRSVFDEREVFGNCRGSLTDAEIEDVLGKNTFRSTLLFESRGFSPPLKSPQPLHR